MKPENLLLDEAGDIRITDFGFSSMKDHDVNSELLYTQCGTPDYVAPEIIECVEVGYNGAKVDVWSCGIILYALLVGSLPFREDDTEKLYDLILSCKVKYPSFLSAGATDLLRHLLVRDPAKRASCAEIKRHPWFLVDYAGDDARSLRKPAFYNKGPSVPLARSSMSQASNTGISEHAVGSLAAPSADSGSRPKATGGGAPQNASFAPEKEPPVRKPSPSGRVAAMIKAHEEHGSPVDPSTAPLSAFTVVQDRPATPAQRKMLQPPTEVPSVAAALHPMRSAVWSANEPPRTLLSANVQEMQASIVGLPFSIGRQTSHTAAHDVMDSSSGNHHPAVIERMPEMLTDEADDDDFNDEARSSDNESVEDYESKPVPILNLPTTEPFIRHQTAQGIGQHRQMSIGVPTGARHRSDSHTRAISDMGVPHMSAAPMEQLPPLHPSQHVLSGRSFRSGSPSVRANSPRFRRIENGKESANRQSERESRTSFSPARSMRYSDAVRGESPVAPASPMDKEGSWRSADHGIYRNAVPWHDNGYPADGGGEAGAAYSDISLRMWDLVERWRSTLLHERVGPSSHMPELRMVHRAIQSQVAAISDVHEKVAIYEQFMVLFGREGLGDVAGWRFGDESEHGSPHSRGMPPADMSSEEDQGWSPTYHDAAPDKAELVRRRDVSDLLNSWMRKSSTSPHGQSGFAGSTSRPNSVDGRLDLDDGGAPIDVSELQRMLQHNHHYHDAALEKEIDRLMKASLDSALLTADSTGDVPRSISQTGSGIGDTYGSQQDIAIPQVDGIDSFVGGSRPGLSGKLESDFDNSGSAFSAYGFPPSPGGTADPLVSPPPTPTRLNGKKPEMAVSMGLDDVEYYGPDRRGVHTKLKGVLIQIKQRNQRLVESKTQFQSSQEPDTILSIISRILRGMKASVQLKKETKRKLRCSLPFPTGALQATIELYVGENGFTTVAFKRSRQDRGKTDVLAFTNFFHLVHTHFVSEVQMRGPRVQSKLPPSSGHHAKRRSQPAGQQRCVDVDMYSDGSLTGDFESSGPSSQTESFSRLQVRRGLEGQHRNRAPRAVSDMR